MAMAAARQLRSVTSEAGEGAAVPAGRFSSVAKAALSGTTRDVLVAMRDRIATAIDDDGTAARDLAALSKRLIEVARDIEAWDAREAEGAAGGGGPVEDEAYDPSAI